MNCYLYCRKSTEDKSRQIQSIDDQKKIMTEIAKCRGLKIREIFIDEKSAGKPFQRPAYQEMMQKIKNDTESIIISWKIDRLSRNAIDNGELSWLLQKGIIKEIITSDRTYLPQDNVLLFMVESAMANQFIRDLSKNVKRGMQSCVDKGVFPAIAPFGYLNFGNKKGNKTIIPDPKYFKIIQNLWELLLTEKYQLADLYRIMKKEYPLYRKGKLLSFSSFHNLFQNPFYCGLFRWGGKLHLGIHQKMITQSEFQKAHNFLHKKDKTRERDLVFEFKGLFSCGTCNAMLTAERKTKYIISTKCNKSFDYYRCVHRKRNTECREKPLSKKLIIKQLKEEIDKLYLPQEIINFGLEQLKEKNGYETEIQALTLKNIKKQIVSYKKKKEQVEENIVLESDFDIRSLMKVKYEEFKIQIQKLREDYETLQNEVENNNQDIIESLKVIKNAQILIHSEEKNKKKRLFQSLGTDWKISDKKLYYEPHYVSRAVVKTKEFFRQKNDVFEPMLNTINTSKVLTHEQVITVWYTLWNFIKNSKK